MCHRPHRRRPAYSREDQRPASRRSRSQGRSSHRSTAAANLIDQRDQRPTGGVQLETAPTLWQQRLDRAVAVLMICRGIRSSKGDGQIAAHVILQRGWPSRPGGASSVLRQESGDESGPAPARLGLPLRALQRVLRAPGLWPGWNWGSRDGSPWAVRQRARISTSCPLEPASRASLVTNGHRNASARDT
jgi:hypothetical protein